MCVEEKKLKEELVNQNFCDFKSSRQSILEQRKVLARMIAETENGIVVLSDFEQEISFIYAGKLGEKLGLGRIVTKVSSAFEEKIFNIIPSKELMERHVLKLRFLQLQKTLPINERSCYNTICTLHFRISEHNTIPILHRTYYLESFPNGSIWLSLCVYTPFVEDNKNPIHNIVNNQTGEMLLSETYERLGRQLLSPREIAVLSLLSKGQSSKQIADALHISVNTVYRHRQNILASLQASNTAAAVEIALRLHLIS